MNGSATQGVQFTARDIERLIRAGRIRQAIAALDAAALEPADRLALLAQARLELAEFDRAAATARQALAADPAQPRAHYVLGAVAERDRRNGEEAVGSYRAALEADPAFAPALAAIGRLMLGAGYAQQAEGPLRRALALDPDDWRYREGAALVAPPAERPRLLRVAYRMALAERPASPSLRLRLLLTYPSVLLAPLVLRRSRSAPAMVGVAAYRAQLARPVLITYVLLTINVLMYLVLERSGGSQDTATLFRFGAKDGAAIVHDHQWWRLLTPVFLHAGITHLLVNSFSLYFVGSLYERCAGRLRLLAVYLIAAIGGSIASVAFSTNLAVGASGAIFGLLGASGVYFFRNRFLYGRISRAVLGQVLFFSALNLFLPSVEPNIDGWAHAGGLLAGIVAAIAVGPVLSVPAGDQGAAPALSDSRPPRTVLLLLAGTILTLCAVAAVVIAWNPAGA